MLKETSKADPEAEFLLAPGRGPVRCHLLGTPRSSSRPLKKPGVTSSALGIRFQTAEPRWDESGDVPHALGLNQGAQMHPQATHTPYKPGELWRHFAGWIHVPSPPPGHRWHLRFPGFNGTQEAIWPRAALCSHQRCLFVCFRRAGPANLC